jgi:dipeptidyl-peptidase-4
LIPVDSAKAIYSEDYMLSDDETKMLFKTATEPIYRRSSRSNYFIYDRKKKGLIPLSNRWKQQNAAFSPDGNKVGFVRDNNLFYKDLLTEKKCR